MIREIFASIIVGLAAAALFGFGVMLITVAVIKSYTVLAAL